MGTIPIVLAILVSLLMKNLFWYFVSLIPLRRIIFDFSSSGGYTLSLLNGRILLLTGRDSVNRVTLHWYYIVRFKFNPSKDPIELLKKIVSYESLVAGRPLIRYTSAWVVLQEIKRYLVYVDTKGKRKAMNNSLTVKVVLPHRSYDN